MSISMIGSEARLEGNWTYSGVVGNIASLAHSLQQLEFGSGKKVCVDCGQVTEADMGGLELLHVWLECARMRGAKPELVNVNRQLQQIMQNLDFSSCLTEECRSTN